MSETQPTSSLEQFLKKLKHLDILLPLNQSVIDLFPCQVILKFPSMSCQTTTFKSTLKAVQPSQGGHSASSASAYQSNAKITRKPFSPGFRTVHYTQVGTG